MKGKTIKIGLIGCGKVALRRHLPSLKSIKEAEVVALADIDEEQLNRTADKFQVKKRFSDYRVLLNDPEVEAVGICVPLQFHFEVASAALDAGKHVLLEKPLTMSLDEGDQLVDKAAKTDRKIMIGFNTRWHRLVLKAREIIQKGVLGPISLINSVHCSAHYGRYIPEWRLRREKGGGNLIENGTHTFDVWRFLLQSDIEEVCAVSNSTDKCDDEPAVVTARTADGVFLNCVLSDFLPDRNEIEIFGRNYILKISLYRFDGLKLIPLYSHDGDMKNRMRSMTHFVQELPQAVLQARYGGDYRASFRNQWKYFINCILQNKTVECTLDDGWRALQVALACVESNSSGRPVKVSQASREIVPTVSSG